MNNKEKYIEIFVNVFQARTEDVENMRYQDSEGWDSIGHMNLIAQLEEQFDIMFDTDDIIEFESYVKGVEILKRYDVEI